MLQNVQNTLPIFQFYEKLKAATPVMSKIIFQFSFRKGVHIKLHTTQNMFFLYIESRGF